MSAGGDIYDVQDYGAAANGQAMIGGLLGGVDRTSVGSPANRPIPSTGGTTMNKATLRTLAFYLAVGAVVTFAVAHLAPIKAR